MNSNLYLLKQQAQAILNQYRQFAYGLSADNPFSRFSFSEKQTILSGKTRALIHDFNYINPNDLSSEDLQLYREVYALLDELKDKFF